MREAIGATWIFGIVIVFIVVFTGYLAFSVNYAKAFAMKDSIIDILEENNGPGEPTGGHHTSTVNTGLVLNEINEKMKLLNYNSYGNCKAVVDALKKNTSGSRASDELEARTMGVTRNKAYIKRFYSYDFDNKKYNYCVIRQNQDSLNDATLGFSNYFVATFFSIKIDVINMIKVDLNFFVSGQTKNIAYPNDKYLNSESEHE